MKDIIVFSHMMKTAGSSLIKSLIEYYGKRVLDVSYGTRLKKEAYTNDNLLRDFKKKNNNIKIVVGHSMRPCVDFKIPGHNLHWMTFFRDPFERYVSNYFYMYHLKNNFQLSHYEAMKAINIVEWEKVDHFSNYQTRFIAGEANVQKAIDILENKFEWVGITENFKNGIQSFKTCLGVEDLYHDHKTSNPSTADEEEKRRTKEKYRDFILEMNQEDQKLYDYVKFKMWPRFKDKKPHQNIKLKSNPLRRNYNKWSYHIDNQLKFKETQLTFYNLKKFYERWYR